MDEFWSWYVPYIGVPIFAPLIAQATVWGGKMAMEAPKPAIQAVNPLTAYKDGQLVWVCLAMGGSAIADTQHKSEHVGMLVLIGLLGFLSATLFGATAGKPVPYPPPAGKRTNLKLMWLTLGMTTVMAVLTSLLHAQKA